MRDMDRLPHDSRRLSYRNGGYRYALSVDDDYLTVDCQGATYSKVTKTPLKTLKAELTTERWIPDYSRGRAYEVRYLLAGAVVVFFSDVNKYVPLLAPACVVLAAMAMHRAFQAAWPLTKTVIRNDNDEYVVSLPHIDRLESQRKAFEETLLRFISAARNEEHAP
jgi:hypothetical protein